MDMVNHPTNDRDIDGIYAYLAWHFRKAGLSSNCFHYLEVLKNLSQLKIQPMARVKDTSDLPRFRWLTICSSHGVKSEPNLQYWDDEIKQWWYIPHAECKTHEVEECMRTEDW